MLDTRTARLPDCRPLLADPDDLTLVFQPIVDLAGATVAGYEVLARFSGAAAPDVWFADGILIQTRRHAVQAHGTAEPGTDSDVLVRPAIRVA